MFGAAGGEPSGVAAEVEVDGVFGAAGGGLVE